MAWSSIEQVANPLSGNAFIDSIIESRISYNYELPFKGYVNFTFDTGSNKAVPGKSLIPMNADQQQAVRNALGYIGSVTGITFKEQASSSDDIVFAYESKDATNAGVDYSDYIASMNNGSVAALTLYDTITLNANNPDQTNPVPGTDGYLTVLHEVGHALGLKHPFEKPVVLQSNLDNVTYTVMSYNNVTPFPTSYGPIDVAALRYLYGGDGLLGQYGLTVNGSGTPVSSLAPNVNDTLAGLPGISGTVSPATETTSDAMTGLGLALAAQTTGLTLLDSFAQAPTGLAPHKGEYGVLAQA